MNIEMPKEELLKSLVELSPGTVVRYGSSMSPTELYLVVRGPTKNGVVQLKHGGLTLDILDNLKFIVVEGKFVVSKLNA